jgi:hypothetical protein
MLTDLKVTCEKVGVWGPYPLYEARDATTRLKATGTSHQQAISNLLGLIKGWQDEYRRIIQG